MKQKSAQKVGQNAKRSAYATSHGIESESMASRQITRGSGRVPKLGKHSSGQARVTFDGKVYYCGRWGSVEAQQRYAELLRQWKEADGRPLQQAPDAVQATLRVDDLFAAFLDYVDQTGRYRKDGKPTSQRGMFDLIRRQLGDFAGAFPVSKMTESVLISWRDELERDPRLTRRGINRKLQAALQVFKWGRTRGLVSKMVWADISVIEPLKKGEVGDRPERGRARRAVTLEEVEQVAKHCAPQVADILQLQAICGMRPSEALSLRWHDISKEPLQDDPLGCWIYTVPGGGKTGHHGHVTRYMLPPAAQAILENYPALPMTWMFSPSKAMTERRARRRRQRRSKVSPSQARRDRNALRDYADKWGVNEYRRHVLRACEKAGIKPFTPHEVRHGFATWVANNQSILAASQALNHQHLSTTQAYVHVTERDVLCAAHASQRRFEAAQNQELQDHEQRRHA